MNTTTPNNEKAAPLVVLPVDLRDYFAAKALSGLVSGGTQGDPIDSIAALAYKLADAMIRARTK